MLTLDEDALRAYAAKTLSPEPGERLDALLLRIRKSAEQETQRQRELARTDSAAYQAEGMTALLNLLAGNK